ncbi:hypothetical protein ACWERV_27180 [Streptomyces sp. NPDC004031]
MRHLSSLAGGTVAAALRTMGTGGAVAALCALVGVVLLFAGVVLPAVWSNKPARRAAALAVLRELRSRRAQGP